jgi:hypothetical protein
MMPTREIALTPEQEIHLALFHPKDGLVARVAVVESKLTAILAVGLAILVGLIGLIGTILATHV